MEKKLVGISMIRNESDIIEAFVRHNLTLLDELHIVDHGSTDNSKEILNCLKEEGLPIHIYYYNELEFIPVVILNNMMKRLVEGDESIDYIFPLDADEFIYCPSRERLELFLSFIPNDRVGMYTWRGYLPNSTEYNPYFINAFTDQREENLLTPKVIVPREVAKKDKLTIGSHFMVNEKNEDVKGVAFISSQHRSFHYWFLDRNRFDARIIETEDFWIGHYPIRSANQQIKKVLEKSITMAIKDGGGEDTEWEKQLKALLNYNMKVSLDELRLIAFKYRARALGSSVDVSKQQVLSKQKLALKYLHLVEDSPLPTVARLILELTDKLRK